jgi:hypothetical protein
VFGPSPATDATFMTKTKSGITFPTPKGKQKQGMAPQDPHRKPLPSVPRVMPRTKASPKGR